MTETLQRKYDDMVDALKKPGQEIIDEMTPLKADILHMAVGVAGEAGELLDAVKKHVMYNKPIDRENVIEELGDLEFYMSGLRQALSIDRRDTLCHNIGKLTGEGGRYEAGSFSNEQAQQRADKQTETV